MLERVAVSWSGGKDCALALCRLTQAGYDVAGLLSMVSMADGRTHAHGLPLDVLALQAKALGLPLWLIDSQPKYASSFRRALTELRDRHRVAAVAYGCLYAEEDRRWNEEASSAAGVGALFPVWTPREQSTDLLREFVSSGFEAIVCRASESYFDETWVGRRVDDQFIRDIALKDVCPLGEAGEYHTLVLDGPTFRRSLEVTASDVVLESGLWSLDIRDCRALPRRDA